MQPKQPKAETQAMSEYGEPWKIVRRGDTTAEDLLDCHGNEIYLHDGAPRKRIVACVNAMQGIPNPEAVRELIRWAKIWNVTLETDEAHWEAEFQMSEALAALTAPSASPQQK